MWNGKCSLSGKHSREMGNGANFSAIYPKEQLENQNWAHEMGSGAGFFSIRPRKQSGRPKYMRKWAVDQKFSIYAHKKRNTVVKMGARGKNFF